MPPQGGWYIYAPLYAFVPEDNFFLTEARRHRGLPDFIRHNTVTLSDRVDGTFMLGRTFMLGLAQSADRTGWREQGPGMCH